MIAAATPTVTWEVCWFDSNESFHERTFNSLDDLLDHVAELDAAGYHLETVYEVHHAEV